MGPDSIQNLVLQRCSHNLASGVSFIFQRSLDSGILPKDWTDANITPVFKKGNRHLAENYRPVSLTSVLSKQLEHIVCHEMHKHFDKHNVLTNVNHGFRAGFSCVTQLTITVDDLAKHINQGNHVDVAILDFSKAFDVVPHDKLLHKLEAYGIRGSLHKWIASFLTKRHMRVVVDGETSSAATVDSGVPQGTVLGPLLFLCHINDLPDCVSSMVRLFADDCLLYRPIYSQEDREALQNDLLKLEQWASDWGMRFNAKKCYILPVNCRRPSYSYTLNNTTLENVERNPYLGLLISKDLRWAAHIDNVAKKASSTLGFLRRNLNRCSGDCKKTAYIALVRSTLEYGSSVWDPFLQKDIDKLEKIQRKAARFISSDYYSRDAGSMTNMLKNLELQTLQNRRKDNRLCLMYKIANGLVPAIPHENYLKPVLNKRRIRAKNFEDFQANNFVARQQNLHDNCFEIPASKSDIYRYSFFPRTICDWNQLPDTSASSIDVFRKTLLTN